MSCGFPSRRSGRVNSLLARVVLVAGVVSPALAVGEPPLSVVMWDESRMVAVRSLPRSEQPPAVAEALANLRRHADEALDRQPYSVVSYGATPPSGDDHDYVSYANYWWPDPQRADGLPFIRRDGVTNRRQVAKGDRLLINFLRDDVEALALAYYFFGDEKYAAQAIRMIQAWFIDEPTRMNPHLRYAQNVPGRHEGRGAGIIDARSFMTILDAVAVLRPSPGYSAESHAALQRWFAEYLEWLLVSPAGKEERGTPNNHGSWYAAQTARIALFVGRRDVAVTLLREVCEKRIPRQFAPDGSQPAELVRTMSLHYSLFNLTALGAAARVGEAIGVDLWYAAGPDGVGMKKGLDFVRPYLAGEKAWPHKQIREVELNAAGSLFLMTVAARYQEPAWIEIADRLANKERDRDYSALLVVPLGAAPESGDAPPQRSAAAERQPTPLEKHTALAAIRSRLPREWDGTARIVEVDPHDELWEEAARGLQSSGIWNKREQPRLRAIRIEGAMRLDAVVAAISDPGLISSADEATTLHAPLFVSPGATLLIDGTTTKRLRLSSTAGAFVLNAGRLFVLQSSVAAWDATRDQPTDLPAPERFRSYVASLIRSETYLAESEFVNLGYHSSTSYGVSLSSEPQRDRPERAQDWPTGMLVGNRFRGLYYGFYSYEARDVQILDNHYEDCILYAIDPHDRSTRLAICRNLTERTRIKHGIIGSRGVSDSLIADNVSRQNHGSGIMLDRSSSGNMVRDNLVHDNGQGIALYESGSNVVRANVVVCNQTSGIRIRNGRDVLVEENVVAANGDYGFEISSRRLEDHAKRLERGDDYRVELEVKILGNVVTGNRGAVKGAGAGEATLGPFSREIDLPAVARRIGVSELTLETDEDRKFGNNLKQYAHQLERAFDEESAPVTLHME